MTGVDLFGKVQGSAMIVSISASEIGPLPLAALHDWTDGKLLRINVMAGLVLVWTALWQVSTWHND